MPDTHPPPGGRAAALWAAMALCPSAMAATGASTAAPAAGQVESPAQPWVVKITPVYGESLQAVEIRYRHRRKPFILRPGPGQEVIIRPAIHIRPVAGEARFGLDTDLAWEGRCSAAGQWLVIDADRSGPGLSTANLRYNLRTRRLIITSGSAQVLVDLTDGSVHGPASMVGRCGGREGGNLRDHFLHRRNQPFCVTVSDRPGCSGVVWIFDDLASVAVGPADASWFAQARLWPDSRSAALWSGPRDPAGPNGRGLQTLPPLLKPPEPAARGDSISSATMHPFGSQSFQSVRSGAAPAVRPKRLSSWPGKALPPRPTGRLTAEQAGWADRLLEALTCQWQARVDRVRRVAQTVERIRTGLGLDPADDASVEACARSIAKTCAFEHTSAPSAAPLNSQAGLASFPRRLRQLDDAVGRTLADAGRAITKARSLTQHAADLAEAEANCRTLAVGTSAGDEVVCLLMDLAADDGPLPDHERMASQVAQRVLGRTRQDALARLWNCTDVLASAPAEGGLDHPWGRIPAVMDGRHVDGLNLDAAADRAFAALGSALYADPLAARHFQRHLARRFGDRFAITPLAVARLVEELRTSAVLEPAGLEQLLSMCRAVRRERRQRLTDAMVRVQAAWRLVTKADRLIDQAIARHAAARTASREADLAYRDAYARQEREVLGLVEWVCRTYADQIFAPTKLTPQQRKRLILSTAGWWVRQWQMDLCWVDVAFDVEIRRRGERYAWRVHNLRVDLLDRPDAEAVVEERLARTPPPQAFPPGPIQVAPGQLITPRCLADLDAACPAPSEAVAGRSVHSEPDAASHEAAAVKEETLRMILPEQAGAILASAELPESESRSQPAVLGRKPRGDRTHGETPAPVEPFGPPAPATRLDLTRVANPQPPVPGAELTIPVELRPGVQTEARHLAVRAGQLVTLMGKVDLADSPSRPIRVFVDLHADDPVATGLQVSTTPTEGGQVELVTVELPSGRWLRRALSWPESTGISKWFAVKFRAPAPAPQSQTLTLVLSAAAVKTNRAAPLAEQTYVFHLSKGPGLIAASTDR